MKVIVIPYSLTGNNEKLATSIALNLRAKQIKIEEKTIHLKLLLLTQSL